MESLKELMNFYIGLALFGLIVLASAVIGGFVGLIFLLIRYLF